ncbi:hypothetical protein J4709_41340 [Actinomadura sp. LCR2-06]|uniref:Uncharacterized protein n=1 Tax=Actinomadura violacea TaxID=2819934 RepID=A0ABS3S6Z3_9ACTN|nr:hypothetical protein [Actinomadura violacea]
MSCVNSGIVAYGYDLGGGTTGWKVREVDAVGLTVAWAEDADASDSLEDLMPSARHLGVELQPYGDDEEQQQYLLVTRVFIIHQTEVLDLTALTEPHDYPAWDEALRQALELVELTPIQRQPAWLGCSAFS